MVGKTQSPYNYSKRKNPKSEKCVCGRTDVHEEWICEKEAINPTQIKELPYEDNRCLCCGLYNQKLIFNMIESISVCEKCNKSIEEREALCQ